MWRFDYELVAKLIFPVKMSKCKYTNNQGKRKQVKCKSLYKCCMTVYTYFKITLKNGCLLHVTSHHPEEKTSD